MPTATSETVALRGGHVVTLEILKLVWALEDRGVNLQINDAGNLRVGPGRLLTPDDRAARRRHKAEVRKLVRYVAVIA